MWPSKLPTQLSGPQCSQAPNQLFTVKNVASCLKSPCCCSSCLRSIQLLPPPPNNTHFGRPQSHHCLCCIACCRPLNAAAAAPPAATAGPLPAALLLPAVSAGVTAAPTCSACVSVSTQQQQQGHSMPGQLQLTQAAVAQLASEFVVFVSRHQPD